MLIWKVSFGVCVLGGRRDCAEGVRFGDGERSGRVGLLGLWVMWVSAGFGSVCGCGILRWGRE